MTDAELGKATIVYEAPDGETVEETVENEYVAYFQDHWIVKTDERDGGADVVRRIPATRVYHVERNVEAFEEEIETLRDQVESIASDVSGEVRTLRNRVESVAAGLRERRSDDHETEANEREGEPIEIEVGERTTDNDVDVAVDTDDATVADESDDDAERHYEETSLADDGDESTADEAAPDETTTN